jgi:hypothetical protein
MPLKLNLLCVCVSFRFDCHWRSISPRATGKEGAYLSGIEYDWIRQSINRNTHSVDRHASHRIKRERKAEATDDKPLPIGHNIHFQCDAI